jgi:hypothetical protein
MPGDLEPLPVTVAAAVPGAGTAALAGKLVGRARAELPAVSGLGEREQVPVTAIARHLRVGRSTLYRALDLEHEAAVPAGNGG